MTKWTRTRLATPFAIAMALGVALVVACSGGAGSSLSSCPDPGDIVPGGACAMGTACASAAALDDCPGSQGSLTCNCTAAGWVCADPTGSDCFPDAGPEGGDEAGDDDAGDDAAGDDANPDATASADDAAGDATATLDAADLVDGPKDAKAKG